MDDAKQSQPFLSKIRSSKAFILTVVNLAVFTDAYLYALIIPVLPFALVERLHFQDDDDVQRWIGILLAAYGAGLLVGSPIAAWFADRGDSRQGPYLWGLIALAASTVAFSLGQSTSVLFVGRLVQGASSAVVHTVGNTILADTVGEAGVGPAMGLIGMSIAFGVLIGPVVGGVLYHNYGYLAVFVSAYALVALDFLLRILLLPSPKKANVKADATYGTFSSAQEENARTPPDGTPHQTNCSSRPPNTTSTDPLLSSSQKEVPERHRHPMLTLLTTPRMLTAILADFMQSVVLTGLETTLPLRIKLLFAYNSKQVALVFLVLTIPSFGAPLVGLLSDRIGAKTVVSLGFSLLAPFLILLRLINNHHDNHDEGGGGGGGESQVALLCLLLLFIGLALNMTAVPAFAEAMYVVDDEAAARPGVFGPRGAYAQAFALMTIAYAAGSLVGPFVGGLLAERVGWDGLTLGCGIVCGLCALPCLYATGGRRRSPVRSSGAQGSCS